MSMEHTHIKLHIYNKISYSNFLLQYVTKKITDFTVENIQNNSKYRPGFPGQQRSQLQVCPFPQHILQHFKVFLTSDLQIASILFTGLCDLLFLTTVVYEENQQVLITSTVSKWLSPEYLQHTLYALSTTYFLKSAENDSIIALDSGWLPSLIFNILHTAHPTRHTCSNF